MCIDLTDIVIDKERVLNVYLTDIVVKRGRVLNVY